MSLTIRLLGSPEITVDHQPLSFRTRKVLALLIYLVVEKGLHSRESLMAFLWPESSPQNTAVTLRGTLSRLRQSLQPVGEALITEAGKVGFDFRCAVDLDLLWLSAATLPETSPEELVKILEIDRGEFMTGFSLPDAPEFDRWAAIQREIYQRQVEWVYNRLTQLQLANHESIAAVKTAARWVSRAPMSEAAYRRLMAAQALTGDRSAALITYAQCRAMLQDEFSMEPARETVVLAENITQDQLPKGPYEGRGVSEFSRVIPPGPRSREILLPFEGRAAEHSQLVVAFHQTRQDGAQVAVLIGEAGIGKTRLINAFQEWVVLESPGVEIWNGRAFETGGSLPYQPLIEALRMRLEQENAPDDLLEDVWLAELSQLMPELRGRYPDLPAAVIGDADFVRSRLFEAVATLGSALADRHPAIFVLDDMQWANSDTMDMVQYAARRWRENGTPILLLLTVRQENFATSALLRDWLTRMSRDIPLRRILLDNLSGTSVQKLVTQLAAPDTSKELIQEFTAWLWSETKGLPFYIEALLQMLIVEGIITVTQTEGHLRYDFAAALNRVKSNGHVQVPPGVRQAIVARLERLSKVEIDLLLAGAVIGRECRFETLCQIADSNESNALEAFESLLNGRLLTENSAARRPYLLAHDYIREVVYSESREVRRRIFHRRALITLEANRAPAAECAYHAVASLLDEPAFRYSLAAGDEALHSNAFLESLAHYDRAREIAKNIGIGTVNLTSPSLMQLYQNRGRALELTLQYQAALVNYQEMANLATERDDPALQLAAMIAQCIIHATYNPVHDPQKARELGEAVLELALKLKDRETEARALWCLMMVEFHTGSLGQQVLDYGEKALFMARELGMKELEGYVLGNLSWAYSHRLQLKEALQANAQALEIWQALGNLPMVSDAYAIKNGSLRMAGEYEDLLTSGSEALRLSQAIGNHLHHYMALLLMGEIHGVQGRLGQAFLHFEQAATIAEASGDERLSWGHQLYRIPAHLVCGALVEAEQIADQIYASLGESAPIFQDFMLASIALAKIALGKSQEAEVILEQAFATLDREVPFSLAIVPLLVADGHLQLVLGNPARARDRTADVTRKLKLAGGRFYLAELLWLQGRACLALGKVKQAKAALIEAKQVVEYTGERTILWQILVTLSDLEMNSGNQPEADRLSCQAREIITFIADHTGSETLRDSFLSQPAVERVMMESKMRIPG